MKKIAVIFILALTVRLALVAAWHQSGKGNLISHDGRGYGTVAQSLLEGKGFLFDGHLPNRRPPVYPIFLAFFMKFGAFPWDVHLAQAFLGAASCLILYGLTRQIFGEKAGFLAALVLALDYASFRETVSVMPEVLYVFFLLGSFHLLFRARREKGAKWPVLAGLLSGLSLLTKELLVFYYPCVIVWFLLGPDAWKTRLFRAGCFLLGLGLVVAPWVVRSSLIHGRPVLITVSSGHTLYIGNNPLAQGKTTGGEWGLGEDMDYAEYPEGMELFSVEADRYYFQKGLEFIRQNPRRFFVLTGKKIVNMWRPYQVDSPPPARWLTALSYIPVVLLGCLGMIQSWARRKELLPILFLIAYVFLIHAVTIGQIRYRYSVMPFVMIFAAFVAAEIWKNFERHRFEEVHHA